MRKIRKKMPLKTIKAILIIVMIAILIVINAIAIFGVQRFSLKLDMTDNKLYELSDTTHQVVSELEFDINIIVFNSEVDYPIMIKEILEKYSAMSKSISVAYKDPFENPVLVDHYKQQGFDVKQDDIVIAGNERIKKYEVDDLYTFNTGKTQITGMKAEQQITSALIYVNDTQIPIVRFTDGHNERPTTTFMEIFEQNNFDLQRITISVMGISEDTDLLVIASPTRDFEPQEILSLNEYMASGGRMMVFLEPSVSAFENLNAFLADWGIGVGNQVIFEKNAYVSNNPINIVPMYAQHEINQYFGDNRYFLVVPSTRALLAYENAGYDLDVKPLLVSSHESYGKLGVEFDDIQKEQTDEAGPFIVAMTSAREVAKSDGQAKLFVAGSRNIYADDMLSTSSYANADFLTQTINWLTEQKSSINIAPKNITADPINVLPNQSTIIGIILMGVLPIAIFIYGMVVFFRRKNL
jgi:ABC-2 type transport system permease protein